MKVQDENFPAGLVDVLNQYGHDTVTVPQEQLAGQPDKLIWEVVQREKRFLVTLDLDFADGRQFPPGTHGGILVLRPSRQGRNPRPVGSGAGSTTSGILPGISCGGRRAEHQAA